MSGGLVGFLRRLGVNRAVAYGAASRIVSSAAGLAAILLIGWKFTPEEQGYYYTFLSIAALQVFAELGLGTVLIQFASREWAFLRLDERGAVTGEPGAVSRLAGLGRLGAAWFGVASAVLAAGLVVGGWLFFPSSQGRGVRWEGPWTGLSVLTGAAFVFYPFWALLEGCNQVAGVHFYRMVRAALAGLGICGAILVGAGLWAVVAAPAADLIWGGAFLLARYRPFLKAFLSPPGGPRVGWRAEVWPMQLRIAVSWACGYFIFNLFTPVLFRFHGPAAAGRWGMTWAVLNAWTSITLLWISTRVPQFCIWIARREFEALDREFRRVSWLSVGFAAAGLAAVFGAIVLLRGLGHPFSGRLLDPLAAGLLAAASALMQASYAQSFYLRAHRREPFMGLSIVAAFLTAATTFSLGIPFGAAGMAAGYLGMVALVAIPAGTRIWRKCRREWHSIPPSAPAPESGLPG